MKLNYRERIILIIAIVVVIFGVGIFVFIKPKYEKMKSNKEQFERLDKEWKTQLTKFQDIPERQQMVKDTYKKGLDISQHFTDEMTSVQMDEYIQSLLNTEENIKNKASAKQSNTLKDEQTTSIGYFYYTPNIVTYPLYEAADLNGTLAKEAAEKLKESNILSARKSQTISGGEQTFTIRIKYQDLMTFLDKVISEAKSKDDSMLITGVKVDGADFNDGTPGQKKDDENAQNNDDEDEDDNQNQQNKDPNANKVIKPGYADVTITYKALYIQEPREPEVGPDYDETIWNGNEWRQVAAE
jgi:hypothetical protein